MPTTTVFRVEPMRWVLCVSALVLGAAALVNSVGAFHDDLRGAVFWLAICFAQLGVAIAQFSTGRTAREGFVHAPLAAHYAFGAFIGAGAIFCALSFARVDGS